MAEIPWFAWIALAGIAGWVVITVSLQWAGRSGGRKSAEALDRATDAQHAVAQRLDAVESRLGAIERTLTEIP